MDFADINLRSSKGEDQHQLLNGGFILHHFVNNESIFCKLLSMLTKQSLKRDFLSMHSMQTQLVWGHLLLVSLTLYCTRFSNTLSTNLGSTMYMGIQLLSDYLNSNSNEEIEL